jgi:hypothetical protein
MPEGMTKAQIDVMTLEEVRTLPLEVRIDWAERIIKRQIAETRADMKLLIETKRQYAAARAALSTVR